MPFRHRPLRILLVDDEPSVRKVYGETLRAAARDVLAVADAGSAWRALEQERFDAVLLDLRLPDEDGLTLLDRIHERWPELPVAVVTAHGDVATAVEAMRRGARDFVLKPSRPDALRTLVARLLPARPEDKPARPEYEALLREAVTLAKRGAREDAWNSASLALATDPTRPEALHLLGLLTERRAQSIDAQAFYRAALALNPTYGPSRHNLERLTSLQRRGDPRWPLEADEG